MDREAERQQERSLCYDLCCGRGSVEELESGGRGFTRPRQEESTYECALGSVAAGAGDPQRLYRSPDWTARARVTSSRQVHGRVPGGGGRVPVLCAATARGRSRASGLHEAAPGPV
jgi:hypothetical protein